MTREEEIENYLQKIGKGEFDAFNFDIGFESGVEWADAHPHWISVDDELPPEEFVDVWAIRDDGKGGYFDAGIYRYIGNDCWEAAPRYVACVDDITHWMPLPSVEHLKKGGEE